MWCKLGGATPLSLGSTKPGLACHRMEGLRCRESTPSGLLREKASTSFSCCVSTNAFTWRDWQFIAKRPASAPRMLRIVLHTVPRVGRSYEPFSDGFELHLLPFTWKGGLESSFSAPSIRRGTSSFSAPSSSHHSQPLPSRHSQHLASRTTRSYARDERREQSRSMPGLIPTYPPSIPCREDLFGQQRAHHSLPLPEAQHIS